jgi:ArsR family transcriptional regulator, arsenate/arsenite/antimonite-responsive transcriptional repressor
MAVRLPFMNGFHRIMKRAAVRKLRSGDGLGAPTGDRRGQGDCFDIARQNWSIPFTSHESSASSSNGGRRTEQMPMKQKKNASRADLKFRAFSDETRLRILHLLLNGELCVGDVVAIIDVPQPTASRHLAYLRKSGLVQTRKDGLWTFYSLAPAKTVFHTRLLECLSACHGEAPVLRADQKRAKRLRKNGGCCPPAKIS